jgi:hypothetical protein
VVHAFSNGGGIILGKFADIVRKEDVGVNLIGVIGDSCPGKLSMSRGYHAAAVNILAPLRQSLGGANSVTFRFLKALVAWLPTFISAYWLLRELSRPRRQLSKVRLAAGLLAYILVQSGGPRSDLYFQQIASIPSPVLLLYSDSDDLVRSHSVERLARCRARAGLETKKRNFMTSSHVQHYRKFPKEYVFQITSFLGSLVQERRKVVK